MTPLLALGLGVALAHDPAVSTVELRELEAGWVAQISLSTEGAHQTLRARHGDFEAFDTDRWKAALVGHVRETLVVSAADGPVALGAGGVRVGPHQTDLFFEVPGLDADQGFSLRAGLLALPGQTQVVRVRPRDQPARRVVRTASSGFSVTWPDDFAARVGERAPEPADERPHDDDRRTHEAGDGRRHAGSAPTLAGAGAGALGLCLVGLVTASVSRRRDDGTAPRLE